MLPAVIYHLEFLRNAFFYLALLFIYEKFMFLLDQLLSRKARTGSCFSPLNAIHPSDAGNTFHGFLLLNFCVIFNESFMVLLQVLMLHLLDLSLQLKLF